MSDQAGQAARQRLVHSHLICNSTLFQLAVNRHKPRGRAGTSTTSCERLSALQQLADKQSKAALLRVLDWRLRERRLP